MDARACKSGRPAADRKVKIYTIGVGTKGKVPFLVNSVFGKRYVYQQVSMDEKSLKSMAKKTGGLYFRAENEAGLTSIWETIDRMEKSDVEVLSWTEYEEHYRVYLVLALGCIALSALLANTRFLRVP